MRTMQEDRAPEPTPARTRIVVEDDHDIIKVVVAPQSLVRPRARGRDEPVVGGARRIVAPPLPGMQGPQGEGSLASTQPVRAIESFEKTERADRGRMIAFPLGPAQSCSTERARKDERPSVEPSHPELSWSSWRCGTHHHKASQAGRGWPERHCGDRGVFFCEQFHRAVRLQGTCPCGRSRYLAARGGAHRGKLGYEHHGTPARCDPAVRFRSSGSKSDRTRLGLDPDRQAGTYPRRGHRRQFLRDHSALVHFRAIDSRRFLAGGSRGERPGGLLARKRPASRGATRQDRSRASP